LTNKIKESGLGSNSTNLRKMLEVDPDTGTLKASREEIKNFNKDIEKLKEKLVEANKDTIGEIRNDYIKLFGSLPDEL
jgi:ribosome recycling factor